MPNNNNRPESPVNRDRRNSITLTDEEIDIIAEKAAEKAVAKMTTAVYREVGRTIVQRFFWIVGLSALGLYFWLQSKGFIPAGAAKP